MEVTSNLAAAMSSIGLLRRDMKHIEGVDNYHQCLHPRVFVVAKSSTHSLNVLHVVKAASQDCVSGVSIVLLSMYVVIVSRILQANMQKTMSLKSSSRVASGALGFHAVCEFVLYAPATNSPKPVPDVASLI
jgi:hypothetical protein